ncbi:MAG: methionyl-tRNA formyltransferase [Bacteroidetes bacterium GWA2_31_9]|nr:MAG: methionyl-tRNA formyltransferase [Bacteroidetes bacterium GWA2_31_9]
MSLDSNFSIVFMGTPEFAVHSLDCLFQNNFNVVGVVTAPDKPAGRGMTFQKSAVKIYSEEKNLKILQPTNLKSDDFINELSSLNADLFVVVAFRMLPEIVWQMPKYGTINLHASLLPQYRGAAPINWAVIYGDSVTGVTTFFIEKEIDTGNVIMQEKVTINPKDNAGILHDKLMEVGGKLIIKTVDAIRNNNIIIKSQASFNNNFEKLLPAPKIFKTDCKINWNNNSTNIYNFIRGLSPYPTAWTEFADKNTTFTAKIFSAEIIENENPENIIFSDNKTFLHIKCTDNKYVSIKEIQLQNRKKLKIEELLRGINDDVNTWKLI